MHVSRMLRMLLFPVAVGSCGSESGDSDGAGGAIATGGAGATPSSGGASGAAGTGGLGQSGAAAEHDGSPVFTDPEVPDCSAEEPQTFRFSGTIDGTAVSHDEVISNSLLQTRFAVIRVVDGTWREDLWLGWDEGYVENVEMPTDGKIWIPESHPDGGQFLCFTTAVSGILPISEPEPARDIRFIISGGRLGEDCSGREVDVLIRGCVLRNPP